MHLSAFVPVIVLNLELHLFRICTNENVVIHFLRSLGHDVYCVETTTIKKLIVIPELSVVQVVMVPKNVYNTWMLG